MEKDIRVSFIVSEDIQSQSLQNSPLAKTIIINPIFIMRTKWIPTTLSLGITIITSGIDFSKEHDVQITLINRTSGITIYDTGKTNINIPGGNADNFNFAVELKNMDFEDEGFYDMVLVVDGKTYSDYFKVLKIDDSKH